MKLFKFLKAHGEHAVGSKIALDPNDPLTDGLVSKGFIEEAEDDTTTAIKAAASDAGEIISARVTESVNKALESSFKELAKAVKRPNVGTIEGIETRLDYTEIFGKNKRHAGGAFLYAVRAAGSTSPDRDAVEKMGSWENMCRKAGAMSEEEIAKSGFFSKVPSGMNEGSDPDGGALVPPEISNNIYNRVFQGDGFNLMEKADVLQVTGNNLSIPALDDKSRADGSRYGGVTSYWAGEADQFANASRPKFRNMDMKLHKLYVFTYLTEELIADSPFALEKYVSDRAGDEIRFKVNDKMIKGAGAGAGVPLGILKSPALISVAKETGQAAATLLVGNIEKMWMRMHAPCRANAIWMINQDCEAQLNLMAFPVGIAGVPIYQPVGGVSAPSFSTLKGRPVVPIEWASTLGTQGDIMLASWDYYQMITKGGVQTAMSMHIRFQYGELAYRFLYRIDGQPKWDAPITPYNGTTTYSPFVTLDAR